MSSSKLARRIVARYLQAIEFPTQEAFRDYMKKHPNADPKNHTVRENDAPLRKKEAPSKGYFTHDEIKGLPTSVSQKLKDPDALFKQAKEAHEQQLDWLNRGKGIDAAIGADVIRVDKDLKALPDYSKPGPVIIIGPMKTQERSKEKVETEYDGDWSKLGDIVRASIAVDSVEQLDGLMAKLKKSGLKLARKPNDRFAEPTKVGYRDLAMNVVYPNGHIGELQIHLKPILQAKDVGHRFYETVRSIEAKKKREGRTDLTAEEQRAYDDANEKMRDLYNRAWEKATRARVKNASQRHIMAKNVEYYKYDGNIPAYWKRGKVPMVVTKKGEKPVYNAEKFFTTAVPISESEFKKLKK